MVKTNHYIPIEKIREKEREIDNLKTEISELKAKRERKRAKSLYSQSWIN